MGLKEAFIGLGLASLVRAVERRAPYTSNTTFNAVSFTPEAPTVSNSASADLPAFSYDPRSSSTADQHGVANLSMSTLPQNHSHCEITTVTVFSPLPTDHTNTTGGYAENCKGVTLQVPNATLVTWFGTDLPWITSIMEVDPQASTWTVLPNTDPFDLYTEMSYHRAITQLDENGQVTGTYRRPRTNVPVLSSTTLLEYDPKVYHDGELFTDDHGTGFPPLLDQIDVTPAILNADGMGIIETGSHVVWFTKYEIVRASTTTDRDTRPTCITNTETTSLASPASFLWENHGQLDSISEVVSALPLSIVTGLRYVAAEQFVFTAVPTLVVVKINELLGGFNESAPWIEAGSEEIELPWEPDKNPRLPVDVPAMPTEDAGNGGPQMTVVIGGSSTTVSNPIATRTPPPLVTVIDGQVFVPKPISSPPRRPPPPATAVMKGVTASSFAVPVFSSLADTDPIDPGTSNQDPSNEASIGGGSWQPNQGSGQPANIAPDLLPQHHSAAPGSNKPNDDKSNPPAFTQIEVPGVQSDSSEKGALVQVFDPIGGAWVAFPASVIPGAQDGSGLQSSPGAGLHTTDTRRVATNTCTRCHVLCRRSKTLPTPELPAELTVEGLDIMIESSSAYMVNGRMLQAVAGAFDVGQGTTVSLGASGMAIISSNKTTMIAGQPGGKASIPSYNLSLHPDCISVIIINVSVPLTRPSAAYPYLPGTSIFAPPHLTLDNIIYTPLPPSRGGGYNISSTHLAPKSPITLAGPHGPSIISLLSDHTLLLTHQRQTYTSPLPLHQGIHPVSPLPPLLTLASRTFTPLPGDIPRYVLGTNITLTAGLNATATFSSLSPSKIVDGGLAEVRVTVLTVAMARNLSALTVEENGEKRTEALFPATARAWEEAEREREKEKEVQATPSEEGREMAGPAGEGQGEGQAGEQQGRGGEVLISWGLALFCFVGALVVL
ncbi:hypothetical protein KVT40_007211 [Elsinoe batatas]|uniref:Uncharacterized protein n=1 Tax=Elsinoe batatas TaxID=2601811 RepID=A0A8K0KY87_9PEZI|nr:hypothetical protein KVT40_007211 [Elsinoe batatas]